MVVRVYVNVVKAQAKLKRLRAQIKQGANLSVKEIGELGKNYARSIAPVRSGALISNIRLEKINGHTATIVSRNPSYGRKRDFNLPKWLHVTKGLWRSGPLRGIQARFNGKSPTYMYRTTEYLKRVAGAKAKSAFNKVMKVKINK
jgi:hypothetical protein